MASAGGVGHMPPVTPTFLRLSLSHWLDLGKELYKSLNYSFTKVWTISWIWYNYSFSIRFDFGKELYKSLNKSLTKVWTIHVYISPEFGTTIVYSFDLILEKSFTKVWTRALQKFELSFELGTTIVYLFDLILEKSFTKVWTRALQKFELCP